MYCVYKLTDKNGLVYYGSTDNPERRFSEHKSNYNSCCSRKMDIDSVEMDIMKEDIATKEEALWIERDYFENNECINENRPIISQEEREILYRKYYYDNREERKRKQRNYYDNNKEKVHKTHRKYYDNNKEEILIKRKEYSERNKEQIVKYKKEYYKKQKEIKNKNKIEI
jgi:predicted GIY-YIG superfamily endonuclease